MSIDPELDLTIERVIHAPRAKIWSAWTDPGKLARWWLPAPAVCRVERLEPRPGGAFVTSMSEDGTTFTDHLNACFLAVDELERLVWTNAVDADLRPTAGLPFPLTADVTLADHPEGTDYRVVVRHGDPKARAKHEEMGFFEGWGTVTAQLAALAEGGPA